MQIRIDSLAELMKQDAQNRGAVLSDEPLDIVEDEGRFIEEKINDGVSVAQIAAWLVDMHSDFTVTSQERIL